MALKNMIWRLPGRCAVVFVAGLLGLASCRQSQVYADGQLKHDPSLPTWEQQDQEIEPYTGDDEVVLDAQRRFPRGMDVHQKIIWRTCTPNEGVCHNRKEYPDLRTPAGFVAAFDAPCNIQPGEVSSVFDGCERAGDLVEMRWGNQSSGKVELANLVIVPGDPPKDTGDDFVPAADTPGLHVRFDRPISSETRHFWGRISFSGNPANKGKVAQDDYLGFDSEWWLVDDGHAAFAKVRDYEREFVESLRERGVVEGDVNQNGIFGARSDQHTSMLVPGDPESSYLIARMRGVMHGQPLPGSRMPLANQPLNVSEMLALFCYVEGFRSEESDAALDSDIDYRNCSYSDDPGSLNLLGEGVTWTTRISKIFEFNCGGCHTGDEPAGGLELVTGDVYAGLLLASMQRPELNLIDPGSPDTSYLYPKLIDDPSIVGQPMPINPLTGTGRLSEAELNDVLTWIANGAIEEQ